MSRIIIPWSIANDGNAFSSVQSPPSPVWGRQVDELVKPSRNNRFTPNDEGIDASAANDTSKPLLVARPVAGRKSDTTGEIKGAPRVHEKRGRRKPKSKTSTMSDQTLPTTASQALPSTDMPLQLSPLLNATRQERKCSDAFEVLILGLPEIIF